MNLLGTPCPVRHTSPTEPHHLKRKSDVIGESPEQRARKQLQHESRQIEPTAAPKPNDSHHTKEEQVQRRQNTVSLGDYSEAIAELRKQRSVVQQLTESVRPFLDKVSPLFNDLRKAERQVRFLSEELDQLRCRKRDIDDALLPRAKVVFKQAEENLDKARLGMRNIAIICEPVINLFERISNMDPHDTSYAMDDVSNDVVDELYAPASASLRRLEEQLRRRELEFKDATSRLEKMEIERDELVPLIEETEQELYEAQREVEFGREKKQLAELLGEYTSVLSC